MQKTPNKGVKAQGFALSGAGVFYLWLIYMVAMWFFLIVMIPLVHFFPTLKGNDWLFVTPFIIIAIILLLHTLCCFYTVTLEPNMVILKWFGIPFRRIPASRFKMLCSVGNKREDVLCLSCYSVNELVNMHEERLLRSFFDKHSVVFQKRKADWQNDFAREYLNRLRKSPFKVFKERDVVMFTMDPALLYLIQRMYPQLPYKNYTGVNSHYVSHFTSFTENEAVCFSTQLYKYKVHIESDGIHICTKKKEISFIPAQQIKTAVRVDIFSGYDRFHPHHMPLLYISSMSEEELASSRGNGKFSPDTSVDRALMSMIAATHLTLRWNKNKKDSCVVYYTEKNLDKIQRLYPNIQINNVSANWIADSVDRINEQ